MELGTGTSYNLTANQHSELDDAFVLLSLNSNDYKVNIYIYIYQQDIMTYQFYLLFAASFYSFSVIVRFSIAICISQVSFFFSFM